MRCLFPLDSWVGGAVCVSNPQFRLLSRMKEWHQRRGKEKRRNKRSDKLCLARKSRLVYDAFVGNTRRMGRLNRALGRAMVWYLEQSFARLLSSLKANMRNRRSQRRQLEETHRSYDICRLGLALERLGQNVASRAVECRIGNILQSRRDSRAMRMVLLRLLRNVATRCDLNKYARSAYVLTDVGLMHRHMVLLRKSHGLKALRRFAERYGAVCCL
jgi:hypothetical protein